MLLPVINHTKGYLTWSITTSPHLTVRVEVTPDALACYIPYKRVFDMEYYDQSSAN
jgi:hypothetical protein